MVKKKKKNIPGLRFSRFENAWEESILDNISERCTDKNIGMKYVDVLTNSAIQGVVRQNDYFDKAIANQNNLGGYYIVDKDCFVYNPRISVSAPVGPIKRNHLETGIMSPLYTVFKLKNVNLDFIEFYFETIFWHNYMKSIANYGARHDRMNITNSDLFRMPLFLPSLPEQEKIASFLSTVDERIQQLSKKKSFLEQYKKGVMQQIFSQKLRFKDDKGNDFPAWEEKKLGDIGYTYNGLSGKTKEHFGKGFPFITYKQIFDKSSIDITKFDFVEIDANEKQNNAIYGDIFFTTSSETPREVGFSSVLFANIENLYLNSFCFGYRIQSFEIFSPLFAQFLFRSKKFRDKVEKLAQGSTRYNLSKNELMKITIELPKLKEQEKIASFLSPIDKKIKLVNIQLEKTKTWKKGLLQKMFV